jgi:hypothetical protein
MRRYLNMRIESRAAVCSVTAIALWLGLAAQPAEAQKLMSKSMAIASEKDSFDRPGLMVLAAGETVSKKGIAIAFESVRDTEGRLAGYRYAETRIGDLKPDDRIWLFFRDLKHIWPNDPGGATLLSPLDLKGVRGAWKRVTLLRVTREGESLHIDFKEPALLNDGRQISSLDFKIVEGYLVDATRQP